MLFVVVESGWTSSMAAVAIWWLKGGLQFCGSALDQAPGSGASAASCKAQPPSRSRGMIDVRRAARMRAKGGFAALRARPFEGPNVESRATMRLPASYAVDDCDPGETAKRRTSRDRYPDKIDFQLALNVIVFPYFIYFEFA